ncbi:methionyl-tRNA formyltransferase [Malaciobacter marinus]|uniref:formyltransferase family protein n=1 Tax=Malaciobacter marinus TaxID=505249 RepID=UPI000C06BD6E|nr:formyltransferase family protein [Malaciobacter marinus]PHO11966.1 methionyl-tRNA formyltransferase [Malaciobacter marinus]
MKIVFIGTVEFSRKALQKLINIDAEVVGVCTKEKSTFNSDFADLTPLCNENSIPYKFVADINSKESIEWIQSLNPDIIFCFGWSNLIKKNLLKLSPMGVIGYHPAKLPQNRGRHPLIWALALGLKKSASTFFFMDEGADSGDILSQKYFDILDTDDAQTLYNKVIDTTLIQIEDFVPKLQNNSYERIKQSHNLANTWRKRGKTDGKIDFRMSSKAIYNLVRALTKPYVGAHVEYKGQDISIWKVSIVENSQNNIECGKVLQSDNNIFTVKTYDGAIKILGHDFSEIPQVGEYL